MFNNNIIWLLLISAEHNLDGFTKVDLIKYAPS